MRPYDSKPLPIADAFKCAARGIKSTFASQRNFKIQLCIACLAILLAIVFAISPVEWSIILVCIGLVLGLECVNTAVESAIDLVSPEFNLLAGRAKDAAAGAVLVGSAASLGVGIVIFLPKILVLVGIAL